MIMDLPSHPEVPVSSLPAPHPFLLQVAQLLLAKAERSTAPGPVRLSLDRKAAPGLYDAVDVDQIRLLRMQLEDLCATGWVTLRLDPPRAFAEFVDRKPGLELCDFDALAAWTGYIPRAQRWQSQWLAHLVTHWETSPQMAPTDQSAVLDYLARNPLTQMEGLPLEEATRSLAKLTELCQSEHTLYLRETSAHVFQGRSKVLDHREELLRLLGASPDQFAEGPIQLLLAPPPQTFTEVLFVENLVTFEHMADARGDAWAGSLLAFAAGFRGSARRLRSRSGCRVYPRAPSQPTALPAIESWLFGTHPGSQGYPVYFFGDLDYAGLHILANLREVFPQASAWRPGYTHLATLLAHGGGHPPELAAKEKQIDPGTTGCAYADCELLPLLRTSKRFIDQEVFDPGAGEAMIGLLSA